MSLDDMHRRALSSSWWLTCIQDLWQAVNCTKEENIPITSKLSSPEVLKNNSNTGDARRRLLQTKTAVRNDPGRRQLQTNASVRNNYCRFCQNNGELKSFYKSHQLKDSAGNIVCPILRKYTCPSCGATGEKAHTIRHCPLNANYAKMLRHTLSMRRNAAGHITSFGV